MNSIFIIVCVLMTLLQVLNPAMSDAPSKSCWFPCHPIIGTVNNTRVQDVSNNCGSKLYKISLIFPNIKCDNVV
ncbi:hypothetical protein MKW92_020952 [Papaver armeniacum]|nr:hypothetical protein MKW92_020952 [Papaver armeniacum]